MPISRWRLLALRIQRSHSLLRRCRDDSAWTQTFPEAYAQGSRSLLDVQDAQQSYLSARQSVLATAYQYRAALIDLRAALSLDSLEPLTNEGVNS